jgi:hypothetical protein
LGCFALVAQRIEFRGADDGRRQAAQVRGAQRRGAGIEPIASIAQIMVGEPAHGIERQKIAVGVLRPRRVFRILRRGAIRLDLDREQARLPVVGVEVAGDPAAAMKIDDGRGRHSRRAIEARPERAGRTRDRDIGDRGRLRQDNVAPRLSERDELLARDARRQGSRSAQRQFRQQLCEFGIEAPLHPQPFLTPAA